MLKYTTDTTGSINRRGRVGVFECECGCGCTFFRTISTRHPRYANKTHRARAYRARARAMAAAYNLISQVDYAPAELFDEAYDSALARYLSDNRGRP